jgi:PleD family two-component response regulator
MHELWLVAAAGVCALLAALFTIGLADRLRNTADDAEHERARAAELARQSSEMAARAAKFEAEAIVARNNLADAQRQAPDTRASTRTLASITDADTGLFNEQFFAVTLEKRVSAARRGLRPLAVVLIEVAGGLADGQASPPDAKAVAGALMETLRDADTACRLDNRQFAVVLEDTPENGAVWTIERVRRRLAEQKSGQTMWAGVACYPAHAFDAPQILDQAKQALASAKDWRQDRIEVAGLPDE